MGKHNKTRFRGTTIYAEDYLFLDGKRTSSSEPIASVLHRLLRRDKEPTSKVSSASKTPSITRHEPEVRGEQSKSEPEVRGKYKENELEAWFKRWTAQGSLEIRFFSYCEHVLKMSKQEAEEWLKARRARKD